MRKEYTKMKRKFFLGLILAVTLFGAGNAFGQSAVTATWALSSAQTVLVTGAGSSQVSATSEALTGMQVSYSSSVQRTSPTGTAGTWIAESGINTGRYIEFSISVNPGYSFTVSNISLLTYTNSGSNMSCKVYWSNDGFSSSNNNFFSSTLSTTVPGSPNATATPNTTIISTQSFKIRVYAWNSGATTGKYNILSNVVISGTTASTCISPVISSVSAPSMSICSSTKQTLTANGVAGTNALVNWWTGTGGSGTNLGSGTTLVNQGPGTYYARVTADCGSAVESSITVSTLANVSIGTQPVGATYTELASPTSLSVGATGAGLSYQWYSSQNADGSSPLTLTGQTSSTFTPSTANLGTIYYYCIVTGTCTNMTSSIVPVVVNASINPTVGLTGGSSSQTVSAGSAIGTIVYTWAGSATTANISWTGSSITLPTNLSTTLNATGKTLTISGTPSEAGTYNYSVTSTDGTNTSDASSGSIIVKLATPDVSAGVNTSFTTNQGFTAQWTAVSGVTSYTVKVYQGASVVTTITSISAAATSQDVTGLTANTGYTYTVTAIGDGSLVPNSNESSVSAIVRTLTTAKVISAFNITGQQVSSINESAKTISVYVPVGTILTGLTTSITISANASVSPASGVSQDFTSPVLYTVTAEDGSQQVYTVTVSFGTASSDYFQSKSSGNWTDYTTWQSSSDNSSWINATLAPTSSATGVLITGGYTVTVNAITTIPNTTVSAGSTLKATAQINLGSALLVNGTYEHAMDAGLIPLATWNTGSTCLVSGAIAGTPNNNTQSFYNFTWNCPGQTSNLNLTWGVLTKNIINGSFTLTNSGLGEFRLTNSSIANDIEIKGNLVLNSSAANLKISGSATTKQINVIIDGNINITGGTLAISGNGSANFAWSVYGDAVSISNATLTKSGSETVSKLIFAKSGTQSLTIGTGVTFGSGFPLEVATGSILNMGTSVFNGSGAFTLNSGATLVTTLTSGINGNITTTGTKTLNSGANYIFNGTGAQVTGALLTTANNVEINNNAGVTLSGNTTINGTLALTSGSLTSGPNTLTLGNTAGVIKTSGSLSSVPSFGSAVSLTYIGSTPLSAGNEFPSSTPITTLSINNTGGLTLTPALTTVSNLNIGTGCILNVPAGKQMTVNTTITNNGTLNLVSDASGTATILTPASGNVTANVNQFLSANRNWYFSSPVTGATGSVVLGAAEAPTGNSLWQYNEVNTDWNDVMTPTTPLTATRGFIAKTGTDGVITFSGTLNTGDITTPTLSRTGITKTGFNLVGNPYPSYASWDDATKTNVLTSIWYRSKSSGTYKFQTYNSYDHQGTLGGTEIIPPMQAFWVRVDAGQPGDASVTFKNATRSHQDQTDPAIRLKAPAVDNQKVLRLEISNAVNTDEAIVLFNSDASEGFDAYDSPKMTNDNDLIPEIYTIAGTEQVAINGLNSLTPDKEITLGFVPGSATSFILKATQVSNFETGTQILLKDYATGTIQDLADGSPYNFIPDNSVPVAARFSIVFKAPSIATGTVNAIGNTVMVYKNANNQIAVNCANGIVGQVTVSVYNAIGQKLESRLLTSTKTLLSNAYTPGVYFVNVYTNGKSSTQKVIIN